VLDNLKADIVLSSQFVFEHNVFSEFEEDIVDTSLVPGPDFGDIYNIRLISHYSSALQNLEASAIADSTTVTDLGLENRMLILYYSELAQFLQPGGNKKRACSTRSDSGRDHCSSLGPTGPGSH
jgi:hypothetical protein